MTVSISRGELPYSGSSYEFEGYQYGAVGISFLLFDGRPGSGPKLHRHPYPEVFIVQEGQATFTVGDSEIEATGGQILIVPPNHPHKFINSGDGPLRQIDIHISERMITDWLED